MKLKTCLMVCAALFAMMMPADAMAKNKCVPKIYAFGFAASFNDSTVYFTEIHEVTVSGSMKRTSFCSIATTTPTS